MAAMNALMLDQHTLFIADTFVNESRRRGAGRHRHDGGGRGAALRHAAQGGLPVALDVRLVAARVGAAHAAARALFVACAPDIECDGEMQGDAALSESVRRGYLPETTLTGSANLLVLPNLDAANILFNVLKMPPAATASRWARSCWARRKPAHILTPSATVRRVVNMTALAVADATKIVTACRSAGHPRIMPAASSRSLPHAPPPRSCHPRERPRGAGALLRRRRRGAAELQPRQGAGPHRPRALVREAAPRWASRWR
jgi:hypothetical protein